MEARTDPAHSRAPRTEPARTTESRPSGPLSPDCSFSINPSRPTEPCLGVVSTTGMLPRTNDARRTLLLVGEEAHAGATLQELLVRVRSGGSRVGFDVRALRVSVASSVCAACVRSSVFSSCKPLASTRGTGATRSAFCSTCGPVDKERISRRLRGRLHSTSAEVGGVVSAFRSDGERSGLSWSGAVAVAALSARSTPTSTAICVIRSQRRNTKRRQCFRGRTPV